MVKGLEAMRFCSICDVMMQNTELKEIAGATMRDEEFNGADGLGVN
jgi:hypothetical protein